MEELLLLRNIAEAAVRLCIISKNPIPPRMISTDKDEVDQAWESVEEFHKCFKHLEKALKDAGYHT